MPQIDYKEGDRVVCMWDGPWEDQLGDVYRDGVPAHLGVYVASAFRRVGPRWLYVSLVEFPVLQFDAKLFRRARETDISIFKSALAPRPGSAKDVERELA